MLVVKEKPYKQNLQGLTLLMLHLGFILSGKGGIRTPGTLRYGGFQDRCNRPLYHLSNGFCVRFS